MDIFITLKNTKPASGVKKVTTASVDYLFSFITHPLTILSKVFMRKRTYPLIFSGRVYNKHIRISLELDIDSNPCSCLVTEGYSSFFFFFFSYSIILPYLSCRVFLIFCSVFFVLKFNVIFS